MTRQDEEQLNELIQNLTPRGEGVNKLKAWIDSNLISRDELVEKIWKTRHKNCGCCSEQVWNEFISLIPILNEACAN